MNNSRVEKGKMEIIKKCDLCGSTKSKLFITTPDRAYSSGFYTYQICQNCSLIRLSPRPSPKSLKRYYPAKYRAYRKPGNINSFQKLVRYLINHNKVIAKLLIKDKLFYWENKGRILDVGCGSGFYLGVLKNWGWDTYGVEMDKGAVSIAQKSGISNIKFGDQASARYPNDHFDVVRFSHVMEHVPSPAKEIAESLRVLKPKGKILIIAPNINSVFFKIFKTCWYPLEPPRHFYQYSPATITKFLKKVGFNKVVITYNQSPNTLFWTILYSLGFKNVDRRLPAFISYPVGLLIKPLNFLKASDIMEVTATK